MKFEPTESDYNEYVELVTPTSSVPRNCLWAFLVGGVICTIGQGIFDLLVHFDVKEDEAYAYVSLILVLVSVILTSLNLYKKIAKYGGAGALVPITGFANSVAAPAVEYQKEGQVFGIGCKIFTIAGPVILYGIFASWALGLICWVLQMFGIQL